MTFTENAQPRESNGRFGAKLGASPEVSLRDWREQTIIVGGQRRQLGEVDGGTLYHGSSADLEVGDVLVPQTERNFKQSASDAVSITSDAGTAAYWPRQALGDKAARVFVYEIEPIGDVDGWRAGPANYGKNIRLYEGRVPSARIVSKQEVVG